MAAARMVGRTIISFRMMDDVYELCIGVKATVDDLVVDYTWSELFEDCLLKIIL